MERPVDPFLERVALVLVAARLQITVDNPSERAGACGGRSEAELAELASIERELVRPTATVR
jgi:hypothetical protein